MKSSYLNTKLEEFLTIINFIQGDNKLLKIGDKAPDFTTTTESGDKVKLSSFKGKKSSFTSIRKTTLQDVKLSHAQSEIAMMSSKSQTFPFLESLGEQRNHTRVSRRRTIFHFRF